MKKKSTTTQWWLEKRPKQDLKQKKEGTVAMAAAVQSGIVTCLFYFFSYAFLFFLGLTTIRQVVSQICHGVSQSLLQCQTASSSFLLCLWPLWLSSPYTSLTQLFPIVTLTYTWKEVRCAWVQLCFASAVRESSHCCWKRSSVDRRQVSWGIVLSTTCAMVDPIHFAFFVTDELDTIRVALLQLEVLSKY